MTPDAKCMVAKKLKSIFQKPVEIVQNNEKRWKKLLSKIDYVIDEHLLIQWFLIGLSQNIRWRISLKTFKMYEEALTKAMWVEMDEDYPTYPYFYA